MTTNSPRSELARNLRRLGIKTPFVARLLEKKFPFVMRSGEPDKAEFYLEELVNEPDENITAAHVTTWVYQNDNKTTLLALAGHANAPICKQISASLFNALLECPDDVMNDALLVPGAFLLPTIKQHSQEVSVFSVDKLVNEQLAPLQDATGLVQIKKISDADYYQIVGGFKDKIKSVKDSLTPALISHYDMSSQSKLVFLPFFRLSDKDFAPLSFELDLDIFDSNEFQSLLEAHRMELRHELIRDAERRKRVYEEWRDQDIESLNRLIQEVFELLLPKAGARERTNLTKEYSDILIKEPPESLPEFWIILPPQVRSSLISGRTQRLRKFIQSKKVKQISSDSQWESLVKPLQNRDRQVRGMRNYEEATVGDSESVLYISRQETMEWNLPNLVRADDHYISEMEKLLQKFNENDPAREAKIDWINLGTLLDAFLRNWSPVFLPDKSTQSTYKAWCKKRRKLVWQEIHSKLKQQGIRMDPLQVDNVIYAVRSINSKRVCITPYYLTTNNDYMILVDPNYGIPYYVNSWQNREQFVRTSRQIGNKRAKCEALCEEGSVEVEKGNIADAILSFKRALQIHPALSGEIILDRFWKSTSRDTLSELNEFTELVEALSMFDDDRQKAMQKLTRFVQAYPNFLPDPYLLMGYDAVEKSSSVPKVRAEFDKAVKEYNDFIAEIKEVEEEHNESAKRVVALQEEYNQKIQELVAAHILVPTGANSYGLNPKLNPSSQPIEDMLKNLDEKQLRQLIASGMLVSMGNNKYSIRPGIMDPRQSLTPAQSKSLNNLHELQEELESESKSLRKLRDEIDKKAKRIEPLHHRISNLREKLTEARRLVWASLQAHLNDHLIHALALNPEHFSRICKEEMFFPSIAFALHVAPLHDLLKGDEYLNIHSKIQREISTGTGNLIDNLKNQDPAQQKLTLEILALAIQECQQVKYLSEQEINSLKDYQKLLEQFTSVDTLAREMMIRHRLEDILNNFVHQAYKLFNGVAPRAPEITEARKRLSVGQFLFCYYKRSVNTLIGGDGIPIKNGLTESQFTILDSKPLSIARVGIDLQTKTIYVETPQGFIRSVLGFDKMGLEESQHLSLEFERQGYIERLKASWLTPAYAILLTPIGIPARTRRWKEAMAGLDVWLNRIFAYAGIPPCKSEIVPTEQAQKYFDKSSVVERINVDREKIRYRFLEEVDPDQKVKIVTVP